jgi:hypothetical protein
MGARTVLVYLVEKQNLFPIPGLQPRTVKSVGFLRTIIMYGGEVLIVKTTDVPSFQVLSVWCFSARSKKTTGIFGDMAQIRN